ncbi:MAG: PLP-dependent aminotransferase family protein [Clostridia bacterium]|nr:PLP-dependent aminotransferase family protein [Clostridia bacterium]
MDFCISNRMKDMRGSAIREIFKYAANPEVISLAGGNPAPELFPADALADLAYRFLKEEPVLSLQYGITEGYMPLRQYIKERLARVENICREGDDTIVVSGAQQGIELLTKVLVNEGDTVIVEEPSFIGATNAFRSYGAHLVGVPVKEDGMDVEWLEKALQDNKNVKFIYTIPTFQNPTGTTMSLEKRKSVYALAKKYGVLILEDNPYGDLSFSGERFPTIKSMDTEGIVAYSGSFSKVLAPGLRIGFLTAPAALIQKIVVAKQISDVHTPMLTQLISHAYLTENDLEEDIVKTRANYAHKSQTMIQAMEAYFPKDVRFIRPLGGLFIWCDLGHGIDTLALSKKAVEEKIVFVPGNTFMVDMDTVCSTLRLNFSTASDEKITEGIRRLGVVFNKVLA